MAGSAPGPAGRESISGGKEGREVCPPLHPSLPFSPGLFWRGDNAITRIASAPAPLAPPPLPIPPSTLLKPTTPPNSAGASQWVSADTEGTTRQRRRVRRAPGSPGSPPSALLAQKSCPFREPAVAVSPNFNKLFFQPRYTEASRG